MHDALGMQAEFDADGNPLTEVKVRLRPDNQQRKHARAEVAQMQNGDKRQKVHPGGIIQADRSYIDRDGFVNTAWVRGLVRKPEDIENGRDRKSVGWGKSVSVRVDLGGRRAIKKKKKKKRQ